MRLTILAALMSLGLAFPAAAKDYALEQVAEGLDHPWSIAFPPEGGFLVTERPGRLRRVSAAGAVSAPIAGIPAVFAEGQGGLFDVVLAPDYAESGVIFLSYASGDAGANALTLMRAKLEDERLVDSKVIFQAPPKSGAHHFGGRMAFLPDGTLLLTLGDGFAFREEAQRPGVLLGKILRLTQEGAAPPDNPFVGAAGAPEVWSFGHRNPQAILVDPESGRVWSHEHGPRGGDELNAIEPGRNYGWPVATDGLDYSGARVSPFRLDRSEALGFAAPRHVWTPSIAPAGMALYAGEAFPEWRGNLFVAALAAKGARRLTLEGGRVTAEETLFDEPGVRLRDLRAGPDGLLYLLTDEDAGALLRVVPAP